MSTAMLAGAVTSLEASTWHCSCFPASSTGGILDPVIMSGGGGAAVSLPPWRRHLGVLWSPWYAI